MTDDDAGGCASPPCFMHEVDPAYMGLASAADPQQRADLRRWRKAERERLIAERLAILGEARQRYSERIIAALETAIGEVSGQTISAYWPFRAEPDLRPFLRAVRARGGRAALPVVLAKGTPLEFRDWADGVPLERGIWNIPAPAQGAEVVTPDIVIAPVVGFDPYAYRLGYGGGFFDRTLAAMPQKPRIFGVGYTQAMIRTIYPQPHDVPMDAVITQDGVVATAVTASSIGSSDTGPDTPPAPGGC